MTMVSNFIQVGSCWLPASKSNFDAW